MAPQHTYHVLRLKLARMGSSFGTGPAFQADSSFSRPPDMSHAAIPKKGTNLYFAGASSISQDCHTEYRKESTTKAKKTLQ